MYYMYFTNISRTNYVYKLKSQPLVNRKFKNLLQYRNIIFINKATTNRIKKLSYKSWNTENRFLYKIYLHKDQYIIFKDF